MIEHHLDILTGEGEMNTFVVHPDAEGPFPVVLFYMDAPGKREELHDMARRIASVGYYVVLPNLYYRQTREFEITPGSDDSRKRMFELMYATGNDMVVRDTAAMLDFVDAQAEADSAHVGCVGYCMSGPFVVAAAAGHADRIACAASIYGARLLTDRDDSPHLSLGDVKGELYFAMAEHDEWAPKETVEQLQAALDAAGTNYDLEWYPGAHHGFAFPKREGIYDKTSAERHWQRLFSLFRRTLGPGRP
ncbi:MAG TPA: dienelactone hydrolase family protein [Pseudomonadales bacterium]|nr:dienelactone hydrolase family protein [Pseudomonadales bacterium]